MKSEDEFNQTSLKGCESKVNYGRYERNNRNLNGRLFNSQKSLSNKFSSVHSKGKLPAINVLDRNLPISTLIPGWASACKKLPKTNIHCNLIKAKIHIDSEIFNKGFLQEHFKLKQNPVIINTLNTGYKVRSNRGSLDDYATKEFLESKFLVMPKSKKYEPRKNINKLENINKVENPIKEFIRKESLEAAKWYRSPNKIYKEKEPMPMNLNIRRLSIKRKNK